VSSEKLLELHYRVIAVFCRLVTINHIA